MDHFAVARGGAGPNSSFGFQNRDRPARLGERPRNRKADDAGADDEGVEVDRLRAHIIPQPPMRVWWPRRMGPNLPSDGSGRGAGISPSGGLLK